MEIISLNNVSFSYQEDQNEALSNVSLSINKGEFIVVLGHNGSGKSTLAKMLNGLLLPSNEGDVLVYGINTKNYDSIYDIRRRVGMVFQNPDNQMIASIIEDDIAFGPENIGVPREEIIERVDWALKAVDMSEHRQDTPFKMSGGQKQRIAIAGVLAIKPDVLVLDEATAMLDPSGRKKVMDVIKNLNKNEGITIVHITHYMDEAIDADRVIVMKNGAIVQDNTPEEVFNGDYDIESAGLKLPVIARISRELKAKGLSIESSLKKEELVEGICQLLQ